MALNLKDRLKQIQNIKSNNTGTVQQRQNRVSLTGSEPLPLENAKGASRCLDRGWDSAGYQTLKQVFYEKTRLSVPGSFPAALPVLIPDLKNCVIRNTRADLLFFDLETTGLSGGAGTVAFLAAFGRLLPAEEGDNAKSGSASCRLRITQYLLLDYPGENDFLQALLPEFSRQPLVVSYNGKSFDSHILKTRCLMNGIHPPGYLHADLLHPARRLWKSVLENCSQSTVEKNILGIERHDDTPGSLAPDIWFDFLRTGNAQELMGICEHNRRDIYGLASMFAAMMHIAKDPAAAAKKYAYDTEALALRWRDVTRFGFTGKQPFYSDSEKSRLQKTGDALLCYAAKSGGLKASLVYAQDLMKSNQEEEGRKRLKTIACGNFPLPLKITALRILAIDAERQLADPEAALAFADQGLQLPLGAYQRYDFEYRRERLLRKLQRLDTRLSCE